MLVDTLGLPLGVAVGSSSVQDQPRGPPDPDREPARSAVLGLVRVDGGYVNSKDTTLVD